MSLRIPSTLGLALTLSALPFVADLATGVVAPKLAVADERRTAPDARISASEARESMAATADRPLSPDVVEAINSLLDVPVDRSEVDHPVGIGGQAGGGDAESAAADAGDSDAGAAGSPGGDAGGGDAGSGSGGGGDGASGGGGGSGGGDGGSGGGDGGGDGGND